MAWGKYHNRKVVAPVRERGLKYWLPDWMLEQMERRSREGAWIEILKPGIGADYFDVAPVRERGLKFETRLSSLIHCVAPVRERGLKSQKRMLLMVPVWSLP